MTMNIGLESNQKVIPMKLKDIDVLVERPYKLGQQKLKYQNIYTYMVMFNNMTLTTVISLDLTSTKSSVLSARSHAKK